MVPTLRENKRPGIANRMKKKKKKAMMERNK